MPVSKTCAVWIVACLICCWCWGWGGLLVVWVCCVCSCVTFVAGNFLAWCVVRWSVGGCDAWWFDLLPVVPVAVGCVLCWMSLTWNLVQPTKCWLRGFGSCWVGWFETACQRVDVLSLSCSYLAATKQSPYKTESMFGVSVGNWHWCRKFRLLFSCCRK